MVSDIAPLETGYRHKLVTVIDLLSQSDPNVLARHSERIASLATETLRKLLPDALRVRSRVIAFQISQELTRRGIPPCFRGLPQPNDDDPEQIADLLAIDLEWIARQYPEHKAAWRRWKSLTSTNERSRWATINFICNWQSKEMWLYVKGLAMTRNQEWECHHLRHAKVMWAHEAIKDARKDVDAQLRRRWHDRKLTLTTEEEQANFKRWLEIWECASMGAWESPTRIAWLYTAKTGLPLTRQVAAKIAGKLRRDLPPTARRL